MNYVNLSKQLHLPNKQQEITLFESGNPLELIDVYVPLAEFLLQEYICPNEVVRIHVQELVYNSLLMVLFKYKKKGCHLKSYTFVEFFSLLLEGTMKEFTQEANILCVSNTKVLT